MTPFVILTRESTIDQAQLDIYSVKAAEARIGHPVTTRVRYGRFEMLEGDPIEGAVVLEFPDMTAAQEWYFSENYQDAMRVRKAGANYRVFIVEGVD